MKGKEDNMKQKKVNSLLKGVAGVGAALGGAAAFTDADVVYAEELETGENVDVEKTILTQEEASESAAEVLSTSTKNEESASNSYSEVGANSESNSVSAGNSVSEQQS